MTSWANIIKLFLSVNYNLTNTSLVQKSVNYEQSFIMMTSGANVIKLFFVCKLQSNKHKLSAKSVNHSQKSCITLAPGFSPLENRLVRNQGNQPSLLCLSGSMWNAWL